MGWSFSAGGNPDTGRQVLPLTAYPVQEDEGARSIVASVEPPACTCGGRSMCVMCVLTELTAA